MKTVELSGKENDLIAQLERARGMRVDFECGCTLWLDDSESCRMFEGCDPYGNDWFVAIDKRVNFVGPWHWGFIVKGWVDFWSEKRDERGNLLLIR